MSVKREDLDHIRTAGSIVCRRQDRRNARKCYKCGNTASILCDHPKPAPESESAVEAPGELLLTMTTCSRPCCPRHCCYWTKGKHLCKEHAEKLGVWA